MQPFGERNSDLPGGAVLQAWGGIYGEGVGGSDGSGGECKGVMERVAGMTPLAAGTLTLGERVVVNVEKLNRDPWREVEGGIWEGGEGG